MSSSYNARLKPYRNKGVCGDRERIESDSAIQAKCEHIAQLLLASTHSVAFTGAGISTASGIPDFRGPNGVWTVEKRGGSVAELPSVPFDAAVPSFTHRALVSLHAAGRLTHVVSQNVDGLHLRSGLPRSALSELHGNIFTESCGVCNTEYVRDFDINGMGRAVTGRMCDRCCSPLTDTVIDWDSPLPEHEFATAIHHCRHAQVVLTLGTSLRIRPAGNLPARVLSRNGKREAGTLIIVNLQRTHLDRSASIRVFAKCDDVMQRVLKLMDIAVHTDVARHSSLLNSLVEQDDDNTDKATIQQTSQTPTITSKKRTSLVVPLMNGPALTAKRRHKN